MHSIIYFVLFWSGEKEDLDMRLDRPGDKFKAVFSFPVHGDNVADEDNNDVLLVDDSTSSAVCPATATEVLVNS